MSLQQPTKKMSKSDANPKSRILITDTPDDISKKVKGALTDSQNSISYDPATRPGVSNLLEILSIFDDRNREPAALAVEHSSCTMKELKETVCGAVIQGLHGIRERYAELLSADDGKYIDHVEATGAKRARENAEETMAIVRQATGL